MKSNHSLTPWRRLKRSGVLREVEGRMGRVLGRFSEGIFLEGFSSLALKLGHLSRQLVDGHLDPGPVRIDVFHDKTP